MYLEDFREIVTKLKEEKDRRINYIDNLFEVDSSAAEFIAENKYTNSICIENDMLINKLFGSELAEDVFWYLYDHKYGNEIVFDKVTYKITDTESYVQYVNNVYKLPMKPTNLSEET